MAERKRNEKGRCASQEGGADCLTKAVGGFVQHRRNGDAFRIRANLDGDFAARAPKSSCFWTIASHFVVLCHVSRHDKKKLIHFFYFDIGKHRTAFYCEPTSKGVRVRNSPLTP